MTCRAPWCDEPRDLTDVGGRKFCTAQCRVKYDDLKEDARNARLAEAEAHREEPYV